MGGARSSPSTRDEPLIIFLHARVSERERERRVVQRGCEVTNDGIREGQTEGMKGEFADCSRRHRPYKRRDP